MVLAAAACAANAQQPLYQPKGQSSWDYWFAQDRGTTYAFYLQATPETRAKTGASTVGLATSRDLIHWTEKGEVLRANPKGEWNNGWIATGSVWKHGGDWLMVFTAVGKDGGIGLARSRDLLKWEKVGPVRFRDLAFEVPRGDYWQAKGFAAGTRLTYTVLADCYVLPEAMGGWYYMVANAVFDQEPPDKRGCCALLRSRDGREWQGCGILAAPRQFDRLETQQLWRHGNRWYLYFGAARENPIFRANCLYTATSMQGPFEPAPGNIDLPDGQGYYIAKVIAAPDGRDVFLACIGASSLSLPYPVTYSRDGSITLGKPLKGE